MCCPITLWWGLGNQTRNNTTSSNVISAILVEIFSRHANSVVSYMLFEALFTMKTDQCMENLTAQNVIFFWSIYFLGSRKRRPRFHPAITNIVQCYSQTTCATMADRKGSVVNRGKMVFLVSFIEILRLYWSDKNQRFSLVWRLPDELCTHYRILFLKQE